MKHDSEYIIKKNKKVPENSVKNSGEIKDSNIIPIATTPTPDYIETQRKLRDLLNSRFVHVPLPQNYTIADKCYP